MKKLDFSKLGLGLVVSLALGACQAIAGIEDRTLDPNAPGAKSDSALCKRYCEKVMTVCTGANAVYTTEELCLGVCSHMDPGDPIEPVGNTVACRMHEAQSAEREPAEHCRFMGPGGGDQCGSDCEAYCDLFPKVCPDDSKYTRDACIKACGGLTDQDRFDVVEDHEGDTIECRLVHVSSATVKPAEHCSHSPVPPAEPWCTGKADAAPTCAEYCKIEMVACDGPLKQYVDEQQCLDVCATFAPGTNADQKGNTTGCRRYHAFSSTLDPQTHCSHSGPTGDGHCGVLDEGNCESYCGLLAAACPVEFAATMVNEAQCLTECAKLPEAKGDSKYSVTNAAKSKGLSCRVAQAASAFAEPTACAAAVGAAPCDG